MNNPMTDPLEELIKAHSNANGETHVIESAPTTTPESNTPEEPFIDPFGSAINSDLTTNSDINFGDNDLEEEMKAEDEAKAQARKEHFEEIQKERDLANERSAMPSDPYDPNERANDMDYQSDKIGIVTTMVNKVVAKYHLFEGEIPTDNSITQGKTLARMQVMGELIDIYHNMTDDNITPEFEDVILSNWIMPDGTTAKEYVSNPAAYKNEQPTQETVVEEVKEPEEPIPQVNITVEKGATAEVNIDESLVNEMTTKKQINVYVKEIDDKELHVSTVIENSQKDGIISAYDSGVNDMPVTLPASAYRCVMRPINWFDFIRLVAPTSQSRADDELKKWSVIHKHLKNPSIGEFKSFDEFMKHTKYQDRELLMWAILVATADEEETLALTCANPKCKSRIELKYRPRNIVHMDEEHIPAHYKEAYEAAPGDAALALHNAVSNKRKRYKLPDTGIIVEISEPSAYDFVTNKLNLLNELYKRYIPDGDLSELNAEDPAMAEFDYLSANALYITAMSIVKDENGKQKEYRYTNWEDIERIITTALSADDSGVLLKIIQQSRANTSPVSFRIENITCPRCKRHESFINITDIGSTLLFQVSRRLDNTSISLIEMD